MIYMAAMLSNLLQLLVILVDMLLLILLQVLKMNVPTQSLLFSINQYLLQVGNSLQILLVYFLALPYLLHPLILFLLNFYCSQYNSSASHYMFCSCNSELFLSMVHCITKYRMGGAEVHFHSSSLHIHD